MGKQNWSSIVGMVLCYDCLIYYTENGSLERVVEHDPPSVGHNKTSTVLSLHTGAQ